MSSTRLSAGRPKDDDLAALRDRIESLYLNGVSTPTAIARTLAAPENTRPLALTTRAVQNHLRLIRVGWAKRTAREELDGQRAEMVALAYERERTAARLASRHTDSAVGAAYLTVSIKAQERRARLLGLDGPTRTELSGPDGKPIGLTAIPLEAWAAELEPREEARRLRLEAEALELGVADDA